MEILIINFVLLPILAFAAHILTIKSLKKDKARCYDFAMHVYRLYNNCIKDIMQTAIDKEMSFVVDRLAALKKAKNIIENYGLTDTAILLEKGMPLRLSSQIIDRKHLGVLLNIGFTVEDIEKKF